MAGRPKGSKNKRFLLREKLVNEDGISPLEFMLQILRDPTADYDKRLDAAKNAAPYCHPRLASTVLKNEDGKEFKTSLDIFFRGVTK